MQQLQGMDQVYISYELPNTPMNICMMLVYEPTDEANKPVTFRELREHVGDRLHLVRTFRQRLVRVPMNLDRPYWVEDPNFDLDHHLRHHILDSPGDWNTLLAEAASVGMKPLDFNRPLWELYFVEGLHLEGVKDGAFSLLLKMHHSAVDGMSGLELLTALNDTSPAPPGGGSTDEWVPEALPSPLALLARGFVNTMLRPMQLPALMARSAMAMNRIQARALLREIDIPAAIDSPRTRFTRAISKKRVARFTVWDMADVRRIKNAVPGASINDVLMAVIGGALRQYLASKNELPDRSLSAMVPISTRKPEEIGKQGNRTSVQFVRLRTDTEDPIERISQVKDDRAEAKEITETMQPDSMEEWMQQAPAALMSQGAYVASLFRTANYTPGMFNTAISNMPGPPEPFYLRGAKLTTLSLVSFLMDQMSLVHAAVSYDGKFFVTATADGEAMPDPDFYLTCLQESFQQTLSSIAD